MSTVSKRYKNNKELIEENQKYMVDEAISLLKKTGNTKFKESIDVAINLGIDPKQTEQNVRGSVVLPNGTGKNMRVIVFAESEDAEVAKTAGANEVGAEDLAERIKAGFSDFDIVIATPSSMKIVGQLGQILGPKGMMPNPKDGTVTKNIKEAVTNAKKGQAMFRNDKGGVLHCSIGRIEFTEESIKENLLSLITQVNKSKPSSAKGIFIKKITLSSTMGPGIHVEESSI
jgi:large subunit ribosomal protein L1